LIAVSSILTYDVYKKYINPHATEAQVLRVSHAMVAFFALCMGLAGLIFFYIGISMGWLYTFMGVILGSAVVPIALCITWSRANKWGCIGGSIAGFFSGLIAWLVTTSTLNGGVINVTTSGGDYEMLAGNLASIGVGGIVAVAASLIWPEDFDFEETRVLNVALRTSTHAKDDTIGDEKVGEKISEKGHEITETRSLSDDECPAITPDPDLDPVALDKAFRFAAWSSLLLTLVMLLLIPLPLFFASTIYGVRGLSAWVIIGIIWCFCSAFTVVLFPLWESRAALAQISRGVMKDIFAKGSGKHVAPAPSSGV